MNRFVEVSYCDVCLFVPSIAQEALSLDRCRVFLESTPEASRGELASRLSPLLMGVLFSVADIAGVALVV